MKINWFKRSDDPKALLCVGERLGYSCANTGLAFSYTLILAFLTFYYTDVVGIAPGIVGTILLLSRVFDGVSDLLMGWLMDRTRTRFGKARPWILAMAVPHAITAILAFSVPAGFTDMQKYIYAFVTYNLVNTITYTATNIPIFAANCLLTDNSDEHARSGIWMQVGGTGALFLVQYTFLPIVEKLGGGARAWSITAGIFAVIGAILMIIAAVTIRERVVTAPEETKIPLGTRLKAIFTNKYWVMYTLYWLITAIIIDMLSASALYFAKYILGGEEFYGTYATIQSIIQTVLLIVAMTFVLKKLGKKQCSMAFYILWGVTCLIQWFIPSYPVAIACSAIRGVGYAMSLGAQGAMIADSISYGSKKAGFDTSGIGNAGISVGAKMGSGLASVLLGGILEAFHYDGTAATQAASALTGIKVVHLALPVVLCVVGALLLMPFDLYKRVERGEAEI